jgi:hypothetical protein
VKIKSIKAGCAGLVFGVRVANPYEKGQNLLKRQKGEPGALLFAF